MADYLLIDTWANYEEAWQNVQATISESGGNYTGNFDFLFLAGESVLTATSASALFLPIGGKAADSELLDGLDSTAFATAAQGLLADSALQTGDNVSSLVNDAGYITISAIPVTSVNTQTGDVVLDADDIDDSGTTHKFVDQAFIDKVNNAPDMGNVRFSVIDNPLTHILNKNELISKLEGGLDWDRASIATYVDIYGVVKTASAHEPRQESNGWLIEGESTNLLTYSEDFSNAAWSALVGASKTVIPSLTNPDNSNQTTGFNFTSSGQLIRQNLSTNSNNKTFSFYIYIRDFGGVTSLRADYSDGTGVDVDISNISLNTWHRLEYKDLVKGAFNFIDISITQLPSGTFDFSLWGAQLEELPFATSYIPTTTTAVTRSADTVSFNSLANAPNLQSEWTIFFKSNLRVASNSGFYPIVKLGNTVDNGLSRDGWTIYTDPAGDRIRTRIGTEDSSAGSATVWDQGINTSIAWSMSSNRDRFIYVSSQNGVFEETTASSDTMTLTDTSALSTLNITETNYGHISDLRIYDLVLNSDEIKFLGQQ